MGAGDILTNEALWKGRISWLAAVEPDQRIPTHVNKVFTLYHVTEFGWLYRSMES